jgi:hypothetical protein
LRNSGVSAANIDMIFATGGVARVPALRGELERRFSEGRFFHSIVSGLAHYGKSLLH